MSEELETVNFFGYGPYRSHHFREALFGKKIPTTFGYLIGYELTIQHWQDLSPEVQEALRRSGAGEGFRAYSIRKSSRRHAKVAGNIMRLSPYQLEIVQAYDMHPIWYDLIKGDVQVSEKVTFTSIQVDTSIARFNLEAFEVVPKGAELDVRKFLNDKRQTLNNARATREAIQQAQLQATG